MSQQNEGEAIEEVVEPGEPSVETWTEILGIDEQLLQIEEQIISLFHTLISPDYMDVPSFHQGYVENEDYTIFIYTLSDEKVHSLADSSTIPEDPKVVGVGVTGRCMDLKDLDHALRNLRFSAEDLVEDTPLNESQFPISVVKALFVHPDYQDRGIGFQIAAHIQPTVESCLPTYLVVWAKDSDNSNFSLQSILEKFGAECVAQYDREWPEGWRCVKCGTENECTCGCLIYAYGL